MYFKVLPLTILLATACSTLGNFLKTHDRPKLEGWDFTEESTPPKPSGLVTYSDSEYKQARYKQGENTLTIDIYKAPGFEDSLGIFLKIRNSAERPASLSFARSPWAHTLHEGSEFLFWQGRYTIHARAEKKLKQENWKQLFANFSKRLPEAKKPLVFSLFLRSETSQADLQYGKNRPVPGTTLENFFFAPWNKTGGYLGCRSFESVHEATQFLHRQTLRGEAALVKRTSGNKSYEAIVFDKPQKTYAFAIDRHVFLLTGNSISDKEKEIDQIHEAWSF